MSVTVKIFAVGDKCFRHVMNADHESIELRDEDDKTLLIFSADAKVFDHRGRLGNLDIEFLDGHPCWLYCEKPTESCIGLGPDLPTAKVEISKRYIRRLDACAA